MKKVHEIDGIPIYSCVEEAFFHFDDLVIVPKDIQQISKETFFKIHKWCKDNYRAYERKDCFAACHYKFNSQFMKIEDLDLIIQHFPDTDIAEKAHKEKIDFLHPRSSLLGMKEEKSTRKINGHVYLLRGTNSTYKIGKTRNLKKRMKHFCGLPFEISLVHAIPSDDITSLEKEFHDRYSDRRVRGEWFKLQEEEVQEIIGILAYENDIFLYSTQDWFDEP